jgi:hypothetical protein
MFRLDVVGGDLLAPCVTIWFALLGTSQHHRIPVRIRHQQRFDQVAARRVELSILVLKRMVVKEPSSCWRGAFTAPRRYHLGTIGTLFKQYCVIGTQSLWFNIQFPLSPKVGFVVCIMTYHLFVL